MSEEYVIIHKANLFHAIIVSYPKMVDGNLKSGSSVGVRIVAVFEGTKGLLVLLVGFGLLELIHRDLHNAAEQIVRHLHMNPARHYPKIFIEAAGNLSDSKLQALAGAAFFYSAVRLAEAAGLWMKKKWAEWFGLISGSLYLPAEIFEITKKVSWPRITVFVVNVIIVIYLAFVLYRSRRHIQ